MATTKSPPGPKGHWLRGNWPEYRRDPLGFLTNCARSYGDIVGLRFGRERVLLLSHPDYVEYVLNTGSRNFTKGFKRIFAPLLGDGLFTSDGPPWLRQRRLAQGAFQRERLAAHGESVVRAVEDMLSTWRDGQTRDLHADMMRLMLHVAAGAILGIDNDGDIQTVGSAMETAVACIEGNSGQWQWLRRWVPTGNERRLRRALAQLDGVIYRLIRRDREDTENRSDVLSLLLRARPTHDGEPMTDRQARDQAVNLFLAGRETTALALTWTWFFLAHDRRAAAALEKELQTVLSGRPPSVADLPQLSYTEQVVMESLRLFPPAFALGRKATSDCQIGGYDVRAGMAVLLCQWILHRDARFFDDPEQFRPERWADGLAQRLPKFAYFPFGGGPRLCIGNTLAMMIAVLAVATIAQRFRMEMAPGQQVTLWPNVTLRPWGGLKVVLRARQTTGRSPAVIRAGRAGGPKVSLCMIARNEERNLPECLDSVSMIVDEMIVVDTGSTDRTKEVAAQLGAQVVDFPWCDDFSAARNESVRNATGDWIFWLDGDERLDPDNRQRLGELFAALGDENAAYAMKQLSRPRHSTGMAVLVRMIRLFRNDPRIRWQYRVHEQLLPSLAQCGAEVRQTEITIDHLGYLDGGVLSGKIQRNFRLLQLDHAEHPDNPCILFNLGFTHLDLGQAEAAVSLLKRSLELAGPAEPFVRQLFVVLARAQSQLGQRDEALATVRAGRARYPDDAELLFHEGALHAEGGNLAQAEACLTRMLSAQDRPDLVHVHPGVRGYVGRHYLAGVYGAQGRLAEAERQWKLSLADWSNFTPAWRGLGELYIAQGRWDEFAGVIDEMKAKEDARLDGTVLEAEGLLARQEFAAARSIIHSVIDCVPQAVWPRVVLSRIELREGKDPLAAEESLRAVLAAVPNHPEAQHNLAVLLRQNGRSSSDATSAA